MIGSTLPIARYSSQLGRGAMVRPRRLLVNIGMTLPPTMAINTVTILRILGLLPGRSVHICPVVLISGLQRSSITRGREVNPGAMPGMSPGPFL